MRHSANNTANQMTENTNSNIEMIVDYFKWNGNKCDRDSTRYPSISFTVCAMRMVSMFINIKMNGLVENTLNILFDNDFVEFRSMKSANLFLESTNLF